MGSGIKVSAEFRDYRGCGQPAGDFCQGIRGEGRGGVEVLVGDSFDGDGRYAGDTKRAVHPAFCGGQDSALCYFLA